jgi:hypothetical protein
MTKIGLRAIAAKDVVVQGKLYARYVKEQVAGGLSNFLPCVRKWRGVEIKKELK